MAAGGAQGMALVQLCSGAGCSLWGEPLAAVEPGPDLAAPHEARKPLSGCASPTFPHSHGL